MSGARPFKREIYAEAGMPEYWIVNISEDDEVTVEVFTHPIGSTYATQVTLRDGDVLRPLNVPFELPVADIPR